MLDEKKGDARAEKREKGAVTLPVQKQKHSKHAHNSFFLLSLLTLSYLLFPLSPILNFLRSLNDHDFTPSFHSQSIMWASVRVPTDNMPTTQSPKREVGTIARWPHAKACWVKVGFDWWMVWKWVSWRVSSTVVNVSPCTCPSFLRDSLVCIIADMRCVLCLCCLMWRIRTCWQELCYSFLPKN